MYVFTSELQSLLAVEEKRDMAGCAYVLRES